MFMHIHFQEKNYQHQLVMNINLGGIQIIPGNQIAEQVANIQPEQHIPQQNKDTPKKYEIVDLDSESENHGVNVEQSQSKIQDKANQNDQKQKKQSDESMKESEDNPHKIETTSSKKCFNRQCSSKKIYKKIRSKVQQAKYRFLCKQCYENYCNKYYCEFCQQIYSNNQNEEDDDKWIGCDNCDRWNHIQCERKYRDKKISDIRDKNAPYYCLECSQKVRNNQSNSEHKYKYKTEKQQLKKQRKIIQIKKQDRFQVFHKKLDNLQNLQIFLQSFNFKLPINEGLIRDDLDNLRHSHDHSEESAIKKRMKLN